MIFESVMFADSTNNSDLSFLGCCWSIGGHLVGKTAAVVLDVGSLQSPSLRVCTVALL